MEYSKLYQRVNVTGWENDPSPKTPLDADNLNNMDKGIDDLDNRILELNDAKSDRNEVASMFTDVSLDSSTGIITFTKYDGSKKQIDTMLEKVVTNFDFDEQTQKLTLTLEDGTTKEVDLSSFISEYEFEDSDTIVWEVVDHKVVANIRNHSIGADQLETDYLANCEIAENNASNSASRAIDEALKSEGYSVGTQNGIPVDSTSPYYHNNAKYYSDKTGARTLASLDDVALSSVEEGQALVYDAENDKWVNGDAIPKYKLNAPTNVSATAQNESVVLKWTDPDDLILGENTLAEWIGTAIIQKVGSAPTSIEDGTPIYASMVRNQHSEVGYVVEGLENDTEYFFGVFPVSKDRVANTSVVVSATPEGNINHIKEWGQTIGLNYESLEDIPEADMRKLMSKHASADYFMEWYASDNAMLDMFTVNEYAMKWIGLNDYICDKLMNFGTKNLLKPTLASGEKNDLIYTNNGDGTYTIKTKDGSEFAKQTTVITDVVRIDNLAHGRYKILGAPKGSEYALTYGIAVYDSQDTRYTYQIGEEGEIIDYNGTYLNFVFVIRNGARCNNIVFKPMITTNLEATYDDFISYGHTITGDKLLASEFWRYILKDHVPIMTANDAPYGEASASSVFSSYLPYIAFDGTSNAWISTYRSTSLSTPIWIKYKFTNPICIKKSRYKLNTNVNTTSVSILFEGSNDDVNWTPLGTSTDFNSADFANDSYFLYIRTTIQSGTSAVNAYWGFESLQFYGRSLNVSVPTMTSNTAPYGEVISNGTPYAPSSSEPQLPYEAFDNKTTTGTWLYTTDGTKPYVGYDFKKEIVLKYASILANGGSSESLPHTSRFETSLDGITWTPFGTDVVRTYTSNSTDIRINAEGIRCRYVRNVVVDTPTVSGKTRTLAILKMGFYGVDYSDRTERTYLYDHGVELVPWGSGTYALYNSPPSYVWGESVHFEKRADDMVSSQLTDVTYNSSAMAIDNQIDFTPYKLLKARLKYRGFGGDDVSINVSNVNESAYVFICSWKYDDGNDYARLTITKDVGHASQSAYKIAENTFTHYPHDTASRVYVEEVWLE